MQWIGREKSVRDRFSSSSSSSFNGGRGGNRANGSGSFSGGSSSGGSGGVSGGSSAGNSGPSSTKQFTTRARVPRAGSCHTTANSSASKAPSLSPNWLEDDEPKKSAAEVSLRKMACICPVQAWVATATLMQCCPPLAQEAKARATRTAQLIEYAYHQEFEARDRRPSRQASFDAVLSA
jgi:hypothetical protein